MLKILFISTKKDEFHWVSNLIGKEPLSSEVNNFQIDWLDNWHKRENLAKLQNYDVCVLGTELDKSSPHSILQKTVYYHSHIPFIILTDETNWEDQKELLEQGATSCLDKTDLNNHRLKDNIYQSLHKTQTQLKFKKLNETMAEKIVGLEDINERLIKQTQEYVTLAEEFAITQREAEENEIRIRAIIDSSPNGIWHLTTSGETINANAKLKELLGIKTRETEGPLKLNHFNKTNRAIFNKEIKKWGSGNNTDFEIKHRSKEDKKTRIFQIKGVPVRSLDGSIESCLATITDVTETKKAEETIKMLAMTDSLTGLANRNKFNQKLDDAIHLCERLDVPMALMFLDLDKFKTVNDTHGHPVGDDLLIEVSKRLQDSIREVDTVARLGGDEFAIILTNLEELNSVNHVASRIINNLSMPFVLKKNFIETATSIGISFFPKDGTTKDDLVHKADLALYQAKSKGRGIYNLYDADMHKESERIQKIETDIDLALIRGEFRLNYQPQISAKTKKLIGAEALIRWEHPEKGNIPPGVFIPIADNSKLAIPVGDWVLEESCRQAAEWQKNGLSDFCISVNISLRQFQDNDFVKTIENTLQQTMLEPQFLELEITEGMVIDDIEGVQNKLELLKELGVRLAIDDFGTGYSSLAHLKRFPIDKLKVDQSFVRSLHESDIDANIVKTVINLGHSLKLKVIAEGVEEESQFDFLKAQNCDEIQGYLIAKPMEPESFLGWVKENTP